MGEELRFNHGSQKTERSWTSHGRKHSRFKEDCPSLGHTSSYHSGFHFLYVLLKHDDVTTHNLSLFADMKYSETAFPPQMILSRTHAKEYRLISLEFPLDY